MSDDITASDMLMFLLPEAGGQAIQAESASALVGAGTGLMAGFVAGRYFDVENFSFSMSLADDEGSSELAEGEARSYARWRAMKPPAVKPDPPFQPEPGDVSVTRLIDSSSPVLLKRCLDAKPFAQAVVVKRSRMGGAGALSAVLRMEFKDVWIKAVNWEDGDTVVETIKFKYSAVKTTYVQRKPDGTVGAQFPCEWTSPKVPPKSKGG